MNKFTKIVIPVLLLVHPILVYSTSTQSCAKLLSWMIEIWMRNHLVYDCDVVNLYCPNYNVLQIYKE